MWFRKIYCGHPLLVLILAQLFVEKAKAFFVQTNAPKTILTSVAIFAVVAFAAIFAILAMGNEKAIGAIYAFNTALAIDAKSYSAAVGAFS